MSSESNLTELIIAERVRGASYYDIEIKHGIAALEARELVREAIESTSIDDEWEQRAISLLRLEKVIENLWAGIENGSFKHAEALIKAVDQVSQLLALNKQIVQEQKAIITDEQAALVYMIITENNRQLFEYIQRQLKPNKTQARKLEEWPQVSADSATLALETVLYAEEIEE